MVSKTKLVPPEYFECVLSCCALFWLATWIEQSLFCGSGVLTLYGGVVWRILDWKVAWMETLHTVDMQNSAAWIWNLHTLWTSGMAGPGLENCLDGDIAHCGHGKQCCMDLESFF